VSGGAGRGLRLDRARGTSLAEPWSRVLDYLVLLPRLPAGVGRIGLPLVSCRPYLGVLRSSWSGCGFAYSIVWLAFGLRLISAALGQISPSLRRRRASPARGRAGAARRNLALIRFGW